MTGEKKSTLLTYLNGIRALSIAVIRKVEHDKEVEAHCIKAFRNMVDMVEIIREEKE